MFNPLFRHLLVFGGMWFFFDGKKSREVSRFSIYD